MRAYKVLKEKMSGQLVSTNFDLPFDVLVTYEKDKIIMPQVKGSKLFVFADLFYALQFVRDTENKIWIVDAQGLKTFQGILLPLAKQNYENIYKLWNNEDAFREYAGGVPAGTYICNSLRLIERYVH